MCDQIHMKRHFFKEINAQQNVYEATRRSKHVKREAARLFPVCGLAIIVTLVMRRPESGRLPSLPACSQEASFFGDRRREEPCSIASSCSSSAYPLLIVDSQVSSTAWFRPNKVGTAVSWILARAHLSISTRRLYS